MVGYVERFTQGDGDGARLHVAVAQCQGASIACPSSPAVDFGLFAVPWIAAYPMHIGQNAGAALLPANALSQVSPQGSCAAVIVAYAVHQFVVAIKLNHSRTASKCATHFAHNAFIIHIFRHSAPFRQDEAVSHERVDGAEWRTFNKILMHKAVAIGNPALAVGAHAGFGIVGFLTPNGIGESEPERRCPSAHGGVDENVGVGAAHSALDANYRLGVVAAHIAFVGTYTAELCRDAVELEEAEIVVAHHVGASVDEKFIVIAVAQLHAAFVFPEVAAIGSALAIAAHRT